MGARQGQGNLCWVLQAATRVHGPLSISGV